MALQMTTETKYGITLTNAYLRILRAMFMRIGTTESGFFVVGVFASKALADEGKEPLEERRYDLSSPDPSMFSGMLSGFESAMLTTSEYEGATQVAD